MKSHITSKELARYIAGTVTRRKQGRISGHLAECGVCRASHEKMIAAISPRYSRLHASDAAKVRVLRSRDRLADEESVNAPKTIRSLLTLHLRAILAGSLALAAAVAVAAIFLLRPPAGQERVHLAAVMADEGVILNERPVRAGTGVYEHGSISLPDKTMVRLVYGRGFAITLIGPALFTVDRLARAEGSKAIDLEGTLVRGILVSESNGTASPVSYAYDTPDARVEPAGTEFLLQSSGGTTLVLMKTGRVSVKPAGSAERITVAAGSRCTVKGKADITKADPGDMKVFDSMKQLRDGVFEKQLLKPGQEERGKVLEKKHTEGRPTYPAHNRDMDRGGKIPKDKIESAVRPETREQGRINKNRQQIREARKAIRQNRRTAR